MAGSRHRAPRPRAFLPWLAGVLPLLLGALAGAAEAAPEISISPSTIDFFAGPMYWDIGAPPGELQRGSYEVRNVGDAPLVVAGMAITGAGAGLMAFDGELDPTCGSGQSCPLTYSLAPGESRLFLLTCTAAQPDYFGASLSVTSNAAAGAGTAALSCAGLRPPIIQVSPAALDFGIAHWCESGSSYCNRCPTQPLTQTLTITNAAAPPSRLDFYLTPTLPTGPGNDFIAATLCAEQEGGCVVPAGGSLPLEITFRPYQDVLYTPPLTLVSRYPGQAPVQIPFYAEGGHGRLEFDTPDYLGAAPVGQTLTTTLTVHNAGRSCLSFQGPISNSVDIVVTGGYPESFLLAAGESHSWPLACTPQSTDGAGAFLDFYVFYEGISLATQSVYCDGQAAALAVSPATLEFTGPNEVPVGASATRRVTIYNSGDLAAALAAITPSGPRLAAALVGASLPLTLGPGASAEVDVTFTPADAGRVTGEIAFELAGGAGGASLEVVGDGVVLQASAVPAALDFGAVAYPATPAQHIELRNTGTGALAVAGVTVDLPGDFAISGLAAGATIPPGGALGFDVRATPTLLGRRRAALRIDLDRAPDVTIPLDALAQDPALVVTTPDATPGDYALELGAVDVDVGPRIGKIALRNAGAAPIAIASCAIAGDPELAVASACPFAIPPGATAELAIAFAPTAEAESGATVTLTGTGLATGALRLGLHGTGVDQHVALTAMALAFPDTFRRPLDPPARSVTVTNTAAAPLALTSIRVDGAGFALLGPAQATLAPGASQEIAVAFAPAAIADATGHLVLGNADDPQIARVALTGRGVGRTVEVGPAAIDLGAVAAGATIRLGDVLPGAIGLRNVDAAASFTVSSVAVAGSPAYRAIGPDRTALAPGDRATLDVELAADAAGRYDAEIDVFLDGDPEPHARIAVTALAVEPAPEAPPGGGCGCGAAGPAHGLAPLALLLLLRRRRGGRRA